MPRLYVPPSQLQNGSGINTGSAPYEAAGKLYTGIPTPGAVGNLIQPIGGVADCTDLTSMSPPLLTQAWDIYSYSIPFVALLFETGTPTAPPEFTVQLSLLVNNEVSYTETQQLPTQDASFKIANGVFAGDLINPVRLNARERLGIQLGIAVSGAAGNIYGLWLSISALLDLGNNQVTNAQGSISYNVADLPPGRQLG